MARDHCLTDAQVRRFPTFALLLFFALTGAGTILAQNPSYRFAHQFGDGNQTSGYADWGYSITHDAIGNVYVTGQFNGTIDFDPGAGVASLTAADTSDVFVAKYDANGGYLWAFRLGGSVGGGEGSDGWAIAVDGNDNVVVTGNFAGSDDFDPGPGVATLTSTNGASELFVAKYTPTGTYSWAFLLAGAYSSEDISIDPNDNILVTGGFSGTVDFDPGPGTASRSAVLPNPFVAKYSPTGAFSWVAKISPSAKYSGNYAYITGVATDASANVYIGGFFKGTVNTGKGNVTASAENIFVTKYGSAGQCAWALRIGGDAGVGGGSSRDIAVDGSGVYVTGSFGGTVDFNPARGTANLTAANGSGFVAKYTSAGAYTWAFGVAQAGRDLALGPDGNVYVAGTFSGTTDFDPGSGTALLLPVPATTGNPFIGRYTAAGAYVWAFGLEGTVGTTVMALTVAANNDLFITGGFQGTTDFDPSTASATQASSRGTDIFVAGYGQPALLRTVQQQSSTHTSHPTIE